MFVPESCVRQASGFLFGLESSLISGDGYACALLLLHAERLTGNTKSAMACKDLVSMGLNLVVGVGVAMAGVVG